ILPLARRGKHDSGWRGRGLHALCCVEDCERSGGWGSCAAHIGGVASCHCDAAGRKYGAPSPGGRMRGAAFLRESGRLIGGWSAGVLARLCAVAILWLLAIAPGYAA